MVLSRTVHWKLLWGTKNGSSIWHCSKKKTFGTFIFKSADEIFDEYYYWRFVLLARMRVLPGLTIKISLCPVLPQHFCLQNLPHTKIQRHQRSYKDLEGVGELHVTKWLYFAVCLEVKVFTMANRQNPHTLMSDLLLLLTLIALCCHARLRFYRFMISNASRENNYPNNIFSTSCVNWQICEHVQMTH